MQAVEQAATIESLQTQMSALQGQQNDLKQSLESDKATIANITAQRAALLIKDDAASLTKVLELEQMLVDLKRSAEAAQLRFDALTPQITDVQQPLLVLQQKAMENYRIQKTEELSQEAARLAHNKIALWRAGCRAAYDEAKFHAEIVPSAGLLPHQISQVRQVSLDAFDHTGEVVWNEHWDPASASFLAGLTIAPICPPDSAKDLEVLK
jgi:chromosome segregation ATPase